MWKNRMNPLPGLVVPIVWPLDRCCCSTNNKTRFGFWLMCPPSSACIHLHFSTFLGLFLRWSFSICRDAMLLHSFTFTLMARQLSATFVISITSVEFAIFFQWCLLFKPQRPLIHFFFVPWLVMPGRSWNLKCHTSNRTVIPHCFDSIRLCVYNCRTSSLNACFSPISS